nr:hypothetical protein [Walnut Creek virus]
MKLRLYGFLRIDTDPILIYNRDACDKVFDTIDQCLQRTRMFYYPQHSLLLGLLITALEFDHYSILTCSAYAHIATLLHSPAEWVKFHPRHYVADSFHLLIHGKTAKVTLHLHFQPEEVLAEYIWSTHDRILTQPSPFTALKISLPKLLRRTRAEFIEDAV